MALAAHIMSIYLFPKKVLDRANSTVLSFYWGGSEKVGKPMYWKKQNLLEARKEDRGVGLRNINSLNQALLFRQAWRISKKPKCLVGRLLTSKYSGSPIHVAKRTQNLRSASWAFRGMSGLRKEDREWKKHFDLNRTLGRKLTGQFQKECYFRPKGKARESGGLNERSELECAKSLAMDREDETIWIHREDGKYFVKSGYWFLQDLKQPRKESSDFWKILWKAQLSQRWRSFCWKLVHNALPTKDNLRKRKV
ncbi:hypothetical protein RDABS01_035692 [Bienertia sinuspersici]